MSRGVDILRQGMIEFLNALSRSHDGGHIGIQDGRHSKMATLWHNSPCNFLYNSSYIRVRSKIPKANPMFFAYNGSHSIIQYSARGPPYWIPRWPPHGKYILCNNSTSKTDIQKIQKVLPMFSAMLNHLELHRRTLAVCK